MKHSRTMDSMPSPATLTRLTEPEWRERSEAHAARADQLTAGWRERRQTGETHPIEDFLFTYYPVKPSVLRRWSPGAGVLLEGHRAQRRWFIDDTAGSWVDAHGFVAAKASTVDFIETLLSNTATRQPQFACFGLHEWAMLYRQSPDEIRHADTPLRLPQSGVDAVVASHQLACTHIDAFRFFTPQARPRNAQQLDRESQPKREQPGCLHAGMDVYKWATKLGPLIPGELLLDSFDLARRIRVLDMRASPYDVSGFGLTAVPVETPAGKAAYVRQQREFMAESNALRVRVLDAIAVARAQVAAGVGRVG